MQKQLLRLLMMFSSSVAVIYTACEKEDALPDGDINQVNNDKYSIEQTLSDEAQRNTIAFDALAFMTGNLGSQSFLPPGKVADYSGFQYLRDNDPTKLGHNTGFVTIIAFNVLHILNQDQLQMFIDAASDQAERINQYAYERFPLMQAFRRLIQGDIPAGSSGLNQDAVIQYSADLYRLDGELSYHRARLFGDVIRLMSADQIARLNALKALDGVGNWNDALLDPLKELGLEHDVNVGVMTFASEMYAWYAGSVEADVYFCPERQGTYFGSFYLKDWPAVGNPDYTIDEQLTGNAGQNFLNILTPGQKDLITGIPDKQKESLLSLVNVRDKVATELRKFMIGETADSSAILSLSGEYGRYDGEISFLYATIFSGVYQSLTQEQRSKLKTLANDLSYVDPSGA